MKISFDNARFKRDIQKITRAIIKADRDLVEKAFEIIDTVTDKLMEESIKRAPVDEGFLEESHDKVVIKSFILKNIKGHVFISTNAPASDYALYMHENEYKLGARSQAKADASDVEVGRKYMERALHDNERAFGLYIVQELRSFFK